MAVCMTDTFGEKFPLIVMHLHIYISYKQSRIIVVFSPFLLAFSSD